MNIKARREIGPKDFKLPGAADNTFSRAATFRASHDPLKIDGGRKKKAYDEREQRRREKRRLRRRQEFLSKEKVRNV